MHKKDLQRLLALTVRTAFAAGREVGIAEGLAEAQRIIERCESALLVPEAEA